MAHIQIRNVPPAVHRQLKERAAAAGMSLSEYLRVELEREAATPTVAEMLARLAQLPPVDPPESSGDAIRGERARS